MIRIILAIILVVFGLGSTVTGVTPVVGVCSVIAGLVFVGWYCVSKFEDNSPYVQY